jgi:hypothetical protein
MRGGNVSIKDDRRLELSTADDRTIGIGPGRRNTSEIDVET